MKINVKRALLALCLVAVVMVGSIAGTIAWLTDVTPEVKNTFTVGDINIELEETTGKNYHIVPGVDFAKDPTVTVKANSEDCWLFVKITAQNWPQLKDSEGFNKVLYGVTDLQPLEGYEGVYFAKVESSAQDQEIHVLEGSAEFPNGVIRVSGELTKEEAEELKKNEISLTFKAYAIQTAKFDDPVDAWKELNK